MHAFNSHSVIYLTAPSLDPVYYLQEYIYDLNAIKYDE